MSCVIDTLCLSPGLALLPLCSYLCCLSFDCVCCRCHHLGTKTWCPPYYITHIAISYWFCFTCYHPTNQTFVALCNSLFQSSYRQYSPLPDQSHLLNQHSTDGTYINHFGLIFETQGIFPKGNQTPNNKY